MRSKRKKQYKDIAPDEIFLDVENKPGFDRGRFEGRLEQPLTHKTMISFSIILVVAALSFIGRLYFLQVAQGEEYREQSERNRLDHELVFAQRGAIFDRNQTVLAGNENVEDDAEFARRMYTDTIGSAHILGHVSYPKQDTGGNYFQTEIEGQSGVEAFYNDRLAGANGSIITETNAQGEIISDSTFKPAVDGEDLTLTIDARVQQKLYEEIRALAEQVSFVGGAGAILDVHSGEVIALSSFPEYNPQIMTDGENDDAITTFLNDERNFFLNRAVAGLYAPGSIVKPFVAVGALEEGVVTPETVIVSTGQLEVPNPYDPDRPSIFRDWKAHGPTDLRQALAVSSDVYFYQVGGGFEDQRGIGISGIEKYARMFGLAMPVGIDLGSDPAGVIPNPTWKEEHFKGDPWRVGDTYNTSIGQYGFQVTPLQMARATAVIANGGMLVTPHLQKGMRANAEHFSVDEDTLQVVREGMRMAVNGTGGTAAGLSMSQVALAGKTGTAEIGSGDIVNSWVIGFFPYEEPRYAFALVMERGPETNLVGATYVMRQVLDWMVREVPEYFVSQ